MPAAASAAAISRPCRAGCECGGASVNGHAFGVSLCASPCDCDFHKGMTRDQLYAAARKSIEGHKVADLRVKGFKVLKLSRSNKFAKTTFMISGSAADANFLYRVETEFVLQGDAWKLKTMRFYNPLVNQDQEIALPGIG